MKYTTRRAMLGRLEQKELTPMASAAQAQMYEEVRKKIEELSGSDTTPQSKQLSFLNSNGSPTTWTVIPTGGTLNLFYKVYGEPAQQIFVWHIHGGDTSPIQQGNNTIQIQQDDILMYALAPTQNNTIAVMYTVS